MNTSTNNVFLQDRRTPREWGFDDAIKGVSEFNGYSLFAGASLDAYIDGHHTGQWYVRTYGEQLPHLKRLVDSPMPVAVANSVQSRVLAEVRRLAGGAPVSQPKAKGDPACATWQAEGGPISGAKWNISADVAWRVILPVEDRAEYVGA